MYSQRKHIILIYNASFYKPPFLCTFISAREFGDRAAERRAHSNLGNAHIFLGEFERAADHYKRTLLLAQDLGDRAVEAQACYSLGNTYTLLKDYPNAIEYHLR